MMLKHIKLFENFDSNDSITIEEITKSIESKINYDLIDDIKWLSIDHLDNGSGISCNVYLEVDEGVSLLELGKEKLTKNTILSISIRINKESKINWLKWMTSFLTKYKDYKFIQDPKLTYDFKVFNNEGYQVITDQETTENILSTLKDLYPEENISIAE